MKIFRLLIENLRRGSLTLRFPERAPIGGNYRGRVRNVAEECSGCGLCAYVCTSGAIQVQRTATGFAWHYDPAQCTFCSRCMQRCPKHSLSMEGTRPPIYVERGELKSLVNVEKKKPAAAVAAQAGATGD